MFKLASAFYIGLFTVITMMTSPVEKASTPQTEPFFRLRKPPVVRVIDRRFIAE